MYLYNNTMCNDIVKRLDLLRSFVVVLIIFKKCDGATQNLRCSYMQETFTCLCNGTFFDLDHGKDCVKEANFVQTLEVHNIRLKILSLNELTSTFPNLLNLTVIQGNTKKIINNAVDSNKIKILQLRNLTIENISDFILSSLKNLQTLDLTGNRLKSLTFATIKSMDFIEIIKLRDNHWNCSKNLDWVLKLNTKTFQDLNDTKCFREPYAGKPLLEVAKFAANVKNNCPEECKCTMPEILRNPETLKLEPIIEVNCSARSLTSLPSILPAETKILMLERNNISRLDFLVNNSIYKDIQEVYLDNNNISSIAELEGVYWLSHFRVLSLKNNRLTQLPVYALDHALEVNPNMPIAVRIYLGHNPWRCDCVFVPRFQDLLRKYEMQVRDAEDIKCPSGGNPNTLAPILELTRSSVCRTPSEYSTIQILDLVNGILASLIILILGKLAYDYYFFKKTGKLPWIVTKMP